jgi:rubrerythrin
MNIFQFIKMFANEDALRTVGNRRESLEQFKKFGTNAALAAIPASIFLTPQKSAAAALTTAADSPVTALQLALTLEYLEDEFYQTALDTIGLIPLVGRERLVFEKIAQHESSHVAFLQAGLGADSIAKPTFDFTAGGLFDPFNNYAQFLALSQAFEDTGVRAYKGQAGNLISTPDLLQAALQIHSVEARHASEVRRIRGQKGWIVGNDRGGLPSQAQPVYNGEDNTNQAGFNTSTVNNGSLGPAIPGTAGPESFDEPLTGAEATAIASLFIAS